MSHRSVTGASTSHGEARIEDQDAKHEDSPAEWLVKLNDEFGAHIDSNLITALAHEPGQTYDDVHAILTGLAGDALDAVKQHDYAADDGQKSTNSSSSGTPRSTSSAPSSNELEEVERALKEWGLTEAKGVDPEHLRLTDEEDSFTHDEEQHVSDLSIDEAAANHATHTSIAFLSYAFPSRTPAFLQSTLDGAYGDVSAAVDTLTTLELVESGVLDEDDEAYDAAVKRSRGCSSSALPRVKMADDERNLLNGVGAKKSSKRDRQRRKAAQAQANAFGPMTTSAPKRVYVNDVRQGGPSREASHKRLQPSKVGTSAVEEDEDDAAMAARLAREERLAAGLPAEEDDEETTDAAVRDNDWLFSSSVMEQLGLLLSLPSHKVRSVHAQCHMNLRATLHRLIFEQCEKYSTLDGLDTLNEQPTGSTRSLLDGLCQLMPDKARSEVDRYLRATGGRQDAVLDLAQLADRVELSAAGEKTDVLDPRKLDRAASAAVHAPAFSTAGTGEFAWVGDDKPLTSARLAAVPASPYGSAANRANQKTAAQSASRAYALERLREGASSVTFPLNSGHSVHDSAIGTTSLRVNGGAETAAQAARLAQEYTTIAQTYRVRRQEYLAKAARSYSSSYNAAIARGPMRGGVTAVYADEARRLEAKARAFELEAAHALVRYRMLSNQSGRGPYFAGGGGGGGGGGDTVDLHGLTVHQSLTITRQALDAWWPKAAASPRPPPLQLVTGVGRHSRGNVALIRPAVLVMLQRERWKWREHQQGHIFVTGKN